MLQSKYEIARVVGEGSFGKALLCNRKADGMAKLTVQEALLLSKLNHPNIVTFWESFTTSNNLYIVMDFADGGDLYGLVKGRNGQYMDETKVLDIFIQISLGLKHIHDRKILHRDLKTQNIFLTSTGLVKVGDFGVSKVLRNTVELASTMIGTPLYMSPEIVSNQRYNNKSDIWSLGCILYELLCLKMPFGGQSMRQLVHNIVHTTPSIVNPNYSSEIKDACMHLLRKNPKNRPSINTCLAKPLLTSRLSVYLDNYKIHHEFLHTILHGQHILINKVESKVTPVSNSPSNNRVAKPVDIVPIALPPPPPAVPKKIINNNRHPLPPTPIVIPSKFQKMVDEIRQRELQRDKEFDEQRRMIQQHKQQQLRQAENNIIKAAARNQVANRKKPLKDVGENQIIVKAKAKMLELQMLAAKEEQEILMPHKASPRQYEKPWLVSPKKPSNSPKMKNLHVKKVVHPSPSPVVVKPSPVVKKSPNTAEKKIISPSGKGGQAHINRGQNVAMINKMKPINGWLSELELQMVNLKGKIDDIKIAASPKLILRSADYPSTPHSLGESPSVDSYEHGKIAGIIASKIKKDSIQSDSPALAAKKKVISPSVPSSNKVKRSPVNVCNESIIDEQIKKEFLLLRKEIRVQRSAGFREFIKNQRKDHQKYSPSTMATAVDSDIVLEDICDDHNDGVLIIDVEKFTESIKLPTSAPVKIIESKRLQENEKCIKKPRTAYEVKAQREADRTALRELIKNKKKERNCMSATDNVEVEVLCQQESPHHAVPVQNCDTVIQSDRNIVADICEESDSNSNIVGNMPLPLPSILFPNNVREQDNLTDAITPPTPFTSEDYVILLDQMNVIVNPRDDLVVDGKDGSEFDDGSDTDENIVLDDAILDIQLGETIHHLNSSKINMFGSLEYDDMAFDSCYSSAHSFDLTLESDSSDEIVESSIEEKLGEKEDKLLLKTMNSVSLRELLSDINAVDQETAVIPDDYTSLYAYLSERLGVSVLTTALTFLKSISTDSNNDDIDDVYLEQLEEIVGSVNIGCISLIYSLTLL